MKRTLFHWPLDPGSRLVRLSLGEKRLQFLASRLELPSDMKKLCELNPAGRPPVLCEEGVTRNCVIAETMAIIEFLEETHPQVSLLPDDPVARAEVRRLLVWFTDKFHSEVLAYLLFERVEKPLLGLGSPDAAIMREGREHLRWHLQVIENLLARRDWLCGRELTLADLAAAASLSCLDYFADIPFDDFDMVRSWYARLKSRPSFQTLLQDRYAGIAPATHYADLDF